MSVSGRKSKDSFEDRVADVTESARLREALQIISEKAGTIGMEMDGLWNTMLIGHVA